LKSELTNPGSAYKDTHVNDFKLNLIQQVAPWRLPSHIPLRDLLLIPNHCKIFIILNSPNLLSKCRQVPQSSFRPEKAIGSFAVGLSNIKFRTSRICHARRDTNLNITRPRKVPVPGVHDPALDTKVLRFFSLDGRTTKTVPLRK